MKITPTANFMANGVEAFKGVPLSESQVKKISGILDELKAGKLIQIDGPASPGTEPEEPKKSEPTDEKTDDLGLAAVAKASEPKAEPKANDSKKK